MKIKQNYKINREWIPNFYSKCIYLKKVSFSFKIKIIQLITNKEK